MRSLEQLIDTNEPGWPLVKEWIAAATNPVEILAAERRRAEETLVALQVTTRSPMGALTLESGGLLVDHGWVRVLGSGSARMDGDLVRWNIGEGARIQGAWIVAHDVVGGFFAVNGGAFEGPVRNVFYFAPDTLEWEDLDRGYSDFLDFLLTGDLAKFYADARWPGWENDVRALSGDQGFSVWPPPFTKEGKNVAQQSRRAVPIEELYGIQMEFRRQLVAADQVRKDA